MRARATEKDTWFRQREPEREEEEEIPVPTEWELNTFSAVPRFRSAPDPPLPSRYVLSSFLLHFAGPHRLLGVSALAVLTLSVYTYYAKRVTVGGLGSQTRAV